MRGEPWDGNMDGDYVVAPELQLDGRETEYRTPVISDDVGEEEVGDMEEMIRQNLQRQMLGIGEG